MSTYDFLETHCDGNTSVSVAVYYVGEFPVDNDLNDNEELDECEFARGDSNLDGVVGIEDFLAVLGRWGRCIGYCPSDANRNGWVDVNDFLIVLRNWSQPLS